MKKDNRGSKNPRWKDGRRHTTSGYIEVYSPDHPFKSRRNTVPEHRLVMEQKLGRYLTKKEKVHHKNHIKDDNRIENLELLESQSKHMSIHFKKDMSGRRCKKCNNDKTYTDKRGYQFWTKYEDGFICSRCSYKLFSKKRYLSTVKCGFVKCLT